MPRCSGKAAETVANTGRTAIQLYMIQQPNLALMQVEMRLSVYSLFSVQQDSASHNRHQGVFQIWVVVHHDGDIADIRQKALRFADTADDGLR